MKKTMYSVLLVGSLIMTSGLVGCAHSSHSQGSVAIKHSAQEADICLGKNDVKPGDKVVLFKSECKARAGGNRKGGGESSSCTKVKLGEGRVVSILNEHFSTIEVDSGVTFSEGTIVEKQ